MKTFEQIKPGDKVYIKSGKIIDVYTVERIRYPIYDDYLVKFYYGPSTFAYLCVPKDYLKYSGCPSHNIYADIKAILEAINENL